MDGVGKGMRLQCGICLLQNQQDQNCSESKKYAQVHPSQGSTNKSKDSMIEAKHHQGGFAISSTNSPCFHKLIQVFRCLAKLKK